MKFRWSRRLCLLGSPIGSNKPDIQATQSTPTAWADTWLLCVAISGKYRPVGSSTIISAVMGQQKKKKKNKPKNAPSRAATEAAEMEGINLWKKAKVFQLRGQRRAAGCPLQAEIVNKLRARVEHPIDDFVLRNVTTLSVEDARRDPAWKSPTFLVGTNEERHKINAAMIQRFALEQRLASHAL